MLKIIGSVGNQKSKERSGVILYSGTDRGTKKTSKKKSSRMEKSKKTNASNKTGRAFKKNSFLVVKNAFTRTKRVATPNIPMSYFR